MTVEVSGLVVYPVKSLGGRWRDELFVGRLGPVGDRRWMLIDDRGEFLTQRQLPQLCLAGASFDGQRLSIIANGFDELQVSVDDVLALQARIVVRVWADRVSALDAGDAAAAWCSRLAGRVVRLCYLDDESARSVNPDYGRADDVVSFADGFPFLLINEDSISDLSAELGRTLQAERFRPNILIRGAGGLAEESWKHLRIGSVEFEVVKPCSRCVIPGINPENGELEPDVLGCMKKYRRQDGKIYFGQNLIHRGQGRIQLGDRVTVLN